MNVFVRKRKTDTGYEQPAGYKDRKGSFISLSFMHTLPGKLYANAGVRVHT